MQPRYYCLNSLRPVFQGKRTTISAMRRGLFADGIIRHSCNAGKISRVLRSAAQAVARASWQQEQASAR
jgi:hypothetical protein